MGGRVESGWHAWRIVIKHMADKHTRSGEDMPDFENAVVTDAEVDRLVAEAPRGLGLEVKAIFTADPCIYSRVDGILLKSRFTRDSPGGLFKRHGGAGWVMADFLRDKLETLSLRSTPGNNAGQQRRSLRKLWMGSGQSKTIKGHQVIRALLRVLLSSFAEKYGTEETNCGLPWPHQIGFLETTIDRQDIEQILKDCDHKSTSWAIPNLTNTDRATRTGGTMWPWETLVNAP